MATTQHLRLLIVEDDVVDRKLLERLLAQSSFRDHEVRSADCLAGALELLRDHSFDLVLLDLGLPDSQGVESVARIQARAPHVPIIVLSGLDDERLGTQAVQMGVQDYLLKGQLEAELLVRTMRYALERKKAERQLEAAELRYRTIFENSAVAIVMADQEQRLLSWNKFAEDLLGREARQLWGRDFGSLYPASEWHKIRALGLPAAGAQHHFETKIARGNGEIIDVDVSLSLLESVDGGIAGSIAVIQDITQRKRVHEILDRKQKNLEAIFDAAPMGMLLVDDRMRVARANDAIRQMSGKGYPQIVNEDVCAALACTQRLPVPVEGSVSCDGCPLRDLIRTVLAQGEAIRGTEIRPALRDAEQPRSWLSLSIEPVQIDGGKHVVVALSDITDRKRAEEELKETMELKAQFISTVSHELRTPLTSMKEAVTIVLEGVAGRINKDQRHFLDIARRNIDRLSMLIDDVLDLQKLSAGKMKLNLQTEGIATAIEEACTTMQPHARKNGTELTVALEADLPPVVYDRDRIIQVLTNLISNAIKFTPAGGRILVAAQRGAEHLLLKVSDTGLGIPKEDLPKIFDRFYRVHRPGKEIKGTGLGLAIVSKIVAAHEGRIEVESEPDQGTTFTVLLPLAPQARSAVTPHQADRRIEDILSKE